MNSIKRFFNFSHGRNGTFLRLPLLGLWLALNPWGNCFRPALILKTYKLTPKGGKPTQNASFTIRTRTGETTFYWRGRLSFGWSSGHIARWFGTYHDTDFGGIITYSGWLGHHNDL